MIASDAVPEQKEEPAEDADGDEEKPAQKKDEEEKPANPESDDILSSGGALFGALTGKDPSVEEKPKPEKKKPTKAQLERAKKAKKEVEAKKKKEAEDKKKAELKKKKEKEAKDAEAKKVAEAKQKKEEAMLASMMEDDELAKSQDHSSNDYYKIKSDPISSQESKEQSLSETAGTIVGKAKDTVFKGLLGSFAF